MHRIVSYSLDDLAVDYKAVAAGLTDACCARKRRYRVRGVCPLDDSVHFLLLPIADSDVPESYVLAYVEDVSDSGFRSAVTDRWAAGFDAVATLKVGEVYLILFACPGAPTA